LQFKRIPRASHGFLKKNTPKHIAHKLRAPAPGISDPPVAPAAARAHRQKKKTKPVRWRQKQENKRHVSEEDERAQAARPDGKRKREPPPREISKKRKSSTLADDSPEPAATPAASSSSRRTVARAAADAERNAVSNDRDRAKMKQTIYSMRPSEIANLQGAEAVVASNLNQKSLGVTGSVYRMLRRRALDHATRQSGYASPTRTQGNYKTANGKKRYVRKGERR
jgi:hypothetical protein